MQGIIERQLLKGKKDLKSWKTKGLLDKYSLRLRVKEKELRKKKKSSEQ